MIAGTLQGATRKSRDWQDEEFTRTGFATGESEIGHAVARGMRRLGCHPTIALAAGHLAAVATGYNWMGGRRIAELMARSPRTFQRARAWLEANGWLRSELLLPGDLLEGQRAPVRRLHVVRCVARLQRLGRTELARSRPAHPAHKRPAPSAAHSGWAPEPKPKPKAEPKPAPIEPRDPAWRPAGEDIDSFLERYKRPSSAKRERKVKPPDNAAAFTLEELDAWERETAELDRMRRQRGPPGSN